MLKIFIWHCPLEETEKNLLFSSTFLQVKIGSTVFDRITSVLEIIFSENFTPWFDSVFNELLRGNSQLLAYISHLASVFKQYHKIYWFQSISAYSFNIRTKIGQADYRNSAALSNFSVIMAQIAASRCIGGWEEGHCCLLFPQRVTLLVWTNPMTK